MKIYGFTGTRSGLSVEQKLNLEQLLKDDIKNEDVEFHHGDCVGADKDAHDICEKISSAIKIVIHPPSDIKLRAFCKSNNIERDYPYHERNKNIVNKANTLIACPYSNKEILRSGVWSTIRYARKHNINVIIF